MYPYLTEGIGEDILPKNVDFDFIDHFVKVTDKDAAIATRRLSREEALFVGWSCGSAVQGALEYARENLTDDDVMVIILPDHGTRYLGKVYNDNWMKDHGFIEEREFASAKDILDSREGNDELFKVYADQKVGEVVRLLAEKGIDQVPILENDSFLGSITVANILNKVMENPAIREDEIKTIMDAPMQFVALDSTLDVLSSMLNRQNKAVLVRDHIDRVHIITQHDVLTAMTV